VLAARANTLSDLYLSYGLLGGIGTGIIYVGVIGLMVRWFPDRRGLACGIVAAGYDMGAIATTFPISSSLASAGYQQTLLIYGCILGVVGLLAAQGLRRPPRDLSSEYQITTEEKTGRPLASCYGRRSSG
jgi:MFS family permease